MTKLTALFFSRASIILAITFFAKGINSFTPSVFNRQLGSCLLRSGPWNTKDLLAGSKDASSSVLCRYGTASQSESTASAPNKENLEQSVEQLKKVLRKEYASFFDPMEREYYANDVQFIDPLNDLEGVDQYQQNVDMLASRTLLGKILFRDAGIVLHSVTGGDITTQPGGSLQVSNIVTRWTLRMTMKVLPWAPTARFTGISEYSVKPGGPKGVQVTCQNDYWDSINLMKGGEYRQVDRAKALGDFLQQIKPQDFSAPAAAPELPYQLLRRGDGYEVRRYPSFTSVSLEYQRRDEALQSLGGFCSGLSPLGPALILVEEDKDRKTMTWPLSFAPPGAKCASMPALAAERLKDWQECSLDTVPEQVVAVRIFSDASVPPVVRRATKELRECLKRDGLTGDSSVSSSDLLFAQYDAVYSMGKRRGEVWIPLEDGAHPW